jgi:hypothetical protein
MSQVTIYLPDGIAREARREAKKQGKSLSAYVASLLTRRAESGDGWSKDFLSTFGGWAGAFPEIPELTPEARERFD